MTRNNLTEHLRWLMQKKPSIIAGPHKPAATIIYTDLPLVHAELDEDDVHEHNVSAAPVHATEPVQIAEDEFDIEDDLDLAISARITPRSNGRQRSIIQKHEAPKATLSIPQTPSRLRQQHDFTDVDLVDLANGFDEMTTPSGLRYTHPTIPHKRKSDEFEDIDDDVHSPTTKHDDKRHACVHDHKALPLEPPPPYSTVAPCKRESFVDISDDEDALFDFSDATFKARQTERQASTTSERRPIRQQPAPKAVPQSPPAKQIPSIPSSGQTPDTVVSTARQGDEALLKHLFELSEGQLQRLESDAKHKTEQLSHELTEFYDNDGGPGDDPTDKFDQARRVQEALSKLILSKAEHQRLTARRDEQKKRMTKAIMEHGPGSATLHQARVANAAAKQELASFETSCIEVLSICRDEADAFVQTARQAAVQATQMPAPRIKRERPVDNSAFVKQTQALGGKLSLSPQKIKLEKVEPAPQAYASASSSRSAPQELTVAAQNSGHFDPEDFPDFEDFTSEPAVLRQIDNNTANGVSRDRSWPASDIIPVDRMTTKTSKAVMQDDSQSMYRPVKQHQQAGFTYPWSKELMRITKERFGHSGLRLGQLEAMNATLQGKDVFVLMPTGGGKSLCYQLPSQISSGKTKGVTVVISPLLSLMEDQVQHLRQLNIQAFLVNGTTSAAERNTLWAALANPKASKFVQILYITPEMLSKSQAMMNSLTTLYEQEQFARLVIDEAHCVSQWGHDFRPDYKTIGAIRQKFPTVPIMALTATATETVKEDTIHNLGIKGCEVFTRSFNRPNLYYEIREKGKGKEVLASMADIIKINHSKETGIIYCLSRKNCEDIAETLRKEFKINATHFHAGMKADEKSEVQRGWQGGKWYVIVATIAFGMGIDKANVRFVIHHSIPKSLEGYYQETGRAGRDGAPASCYLFFSFADVSKLRQMIFNSEDGTQEQKQRQVAMLQTMANYCESKIDCRRVQVLRYFSEEFSKELCKKGCDVCRSSAQYKMQDVTQLAMHAIQLIKELGGQQITLLRCVDNFRGSKRKDDVVCDASGTGEELSKRDAERLLYALVAQGALEEYQVINKSGFPTQYIRAASNPPRLRHIELAMPLSPVGKSKGRATGGEPVNKRKKRDELPMSTNVSSPVQALSTRRRPGEPPKPTRLDQYMYDNFLVPDEDGEDSDDAFEVLPDKQRSAIISDGVLDDLDDTHRWLVDEFVQEAKQLAQRLTTRNSLRAALFPDPILRQMAMRWTETKSQMMRIPNIIPEQVEHFGNEFCAMVKAQHKRYNEMMGPSETAGTALNPNANVIDLCSDDDEGADEAGVDDESDDGYGSFDLDDDDAEVIAGSAGRYAGDAEVEQFNSRFMESQSAAMRTQPKTNPRGRGGYKKARTYHARKAGSQRYSGGPSSRGGVAKKSRSGIRAKSTAKNRGVIGSMPT